MIKTIILPAADSEKFDREVNQMLQQGFVLKSRKIIQKGSDELLLYAELNGYTKFSELSRSRNLVAEINEYISENYDRFTEHCKDSFDRIGFVQNQTVYIEQKPFIAFFEHNGYSKKEAICMLKNLSLLETSNSEKSATISKYANYRHKTIRLFGYKGYSNI